MKRIALLGCVACVATVIGAGSPEARRGEQAFEKRCTGCHGLDMAKEGPRLRGVYGKKAGTNDQFPYSDALRKSNVTWDGPTLEKWITDTQKVVPGNDMTFRLENARERRDIVAFLEQLGAR